MNGSSRHLGRLGARVAVLAAIAEDQDNSDWNSLAVEVPRFYIPPHLGARILGTRHLRLASEPWLDITLDTIRTADFALATFVFVQSTQTRAHTLSILHPDRVLNGGHPFGVHEWLMGDAKRRGLHLDLGYRLTPNESRQPPSF